MYLECLGSEVCRERAHFDSSLAGGSLAGGSLANPQEQLLVRALYTCGITDYEDRDALEVLQGGCPGARDLSDLGDEMSVA